MRIELEIEELVLHGFEPGERYLIADAVQQELARLLGEQGVPALLKRNAEIEQLDARMVTLEANSRSEMIGALIGKAVYLGLSEPGHGLRNAQNHPDAPTMRAGSSDVE